MPQTVKNLFANVGDGLIPELGRSPGMTTGSSILAWRIPQTENLAGYSPWSLKELEKTKWLTLSRVSYKYNLRRLNIIIWQSFLCNLASNVSSCCSVAKLCPRFHDPTDCSTQGFTVPHHLLEYAQVYVHYMGDAIQSSHPLSPSFLLPSIFPSIRVFSNESAAHSRCLNINKHFSFIRRNNFWDYLGALWKIPKLVQVWKNFIQNLIWGHLPETPIGLKHLIK